MGRLALDQRGVQEKIHDELAEHAQFDNANLNYHPEKSYDDKLTFSVPNYRGQLDSVTFMEILSHLGPLFTMSSDTSTRTLWIYAHQPDQGTLRALERHKDRLLFVLTSTVWSFRMCFLMLLVASVLLTHSTLKLQQHWSGYDRPWETLVEHGSVLFQQQQQQQ